MKKTLLTLVAAVCCLFFTSCAGGIQFVADDVGVGGGGFNFVPNLPHRPPQRIIFDDGGQQFHRPPNTYGSRMGSIIGPPGPNRMTYDQWKHNGGGNGYGLY